MIKNPFQNNSVVWILPVLGSRINYIQLHLTNIYFELLLFVFVVSVHTYIQLVYFRASDIFGLLYCGILEKN